MQPISVEKFADMVIINQILNGKLQVLHLAQQPDGSHWQTIGTNKECHHQQDNAVLQGTGHHH